MMVTKVQKWGNSQGLRLSKHVLDLADIGVGDDVQIIVGYGQITVKKAGSKYDLAELVARIPKRYKAKEVDFGPPVGKEQW
ncbi:MAG TPA: transcriptional regulator/antitoxin, MazE [Blastocatellia bacterium]|nr:transcriptional regulator/antitoxin, MazE [Blastocatellia bacterium]